MSKKQGLGEWECAAGDVSRRGAEAREAEEERRGGDVDGWYDRSERGRGRQGGGEKDRARVDEDGRQRRGSRG